MQNDPASARPFHNSFIVIGLFLVAALCAIVFVQLQSHDRHASLYYLVLMYGLLLPLTIFYLRSDRAGPPAPLYELPPLHLAIFGAAIVAIVLISWTLANGRLFGDEFAYRFQARIFAAGRLAAPPMPGASADAAARPPEIYFEHTIQAPWGWFSKYPPGWPLALTAGFFLHIPWLMNPLLAVAQMLCVWNLARPFGRLCQTLAVSFIASSVYYVMWSIGFMSHAFETTLALLALTGVLESVRRGSLRWLVAAFALVFAATQVRPFTGAVIGAVCAAIALIGLRNRRQLLIPALGIIASAAVLSGAAILAYNWTYTGDMLVSPYAALHGRRDVEEIALSLHGILDNLANTTRWGLIDTAATTFPFLFVLAAYAVVRENRRRFEILSLSLLFPALVMAHVVTIISSGSYNGQRFYYEGFAALAIVAARGAQLLIDRWNIGRKRLLTIMTVLLALQVVRCVVGIQAVLAAGMPYVTMYNYAHREAHAPLVFVHDSSPEFVAKHTNWNAIDWPSSPTIYLMDPGPEHRDWVACRFGRPAWSVITYEAGDVSKLDGQAVCK